MAIRDAAQAMVYFLLNDDRAKELRDMVTSNTYITEAGLLSGADLSQSESDRHALPDAQLRVIGITVQDSGEDILNANSVEQSILIRIFDRGKGYDRIRPVRDKLKDLFREPLALSINGNRGILDLSYHGRTGVRHDMDAHVFYEILTFQSIIEESDEL